MPDVTEQTEVVDTPAQSEVVDASEVEVQPEGESNVSEDEANTDEEPSRGRGDLQEALRQERERYRMLEAQLNDPNAIYQHAMRLGLTEEQAQDAASTAYQQQIQTQQPYLTPEQVDARVEAKLDYEKAIAEFPDLAKDRELQAWAAELVRQGKTHLQAAKTIQKRLGLVKQTAKTEGITQAKTEITQKERAQTAPVNVNTDSDASYMEDLKARMKSYDKKTQENAYTEWIMLKNKKK